MTESARSRDRIFICYRREETAYPAGWLFDRLSDHFGRDQVFKDVDSIALGDDFVHALNEAVASCDVLLALIGSKWLTIKDASGRPRLDDARDYVRLEIETALRRDIRVIPVLVDRARMPGVDDLPASLAGLARRQALELSPAQFGYDVGRLLKVLATPRAEEGPAAQPRPASTQWRALLANRTSYTAVFKLYSGSRQHTLEFKRRWNKDSLLLDGQAVAQKWGLRKASFLIPDEYPPVQVDFAMATSVGGPVQIAVDGVVVYDE